MMWTRQLWKLFGTAAALFALAGTPFAQTSESGGSGTAVTPATPATPNLGVGSSGASDPAAARVGGLSRCENLIGTEKDKCLQDEQAGTRSSGGRPAGAGGSHAPGSTGTGSGTSGAQSVAPSGSVR